LWVRHSTGKTQQGDEAQRRTERERSLAFARDCPSSVVGWAVLDIMQRWNNGDTTFQLALADAQLATGRDAGLKYAAQYEQARALLAAGKQEQARKLFRELYERTFKEGDLPPIDAAFRQSFQVGAGAVEAWQDLLRRTSASLLKEQHLEAALILAWQVWQLGDQVLADEL